MMETPIDKIPDPIERHLIKVSEHIRADIDRLCEVLRYEGGEVVCPIIDQLVLVAWSVKDILNNNPN